MTGSPVAPRGNTGARAQADSSVSTPLDSWVSWRPPGDEHLDKLVSGLKSPATPEIKEVRCANLAFYREHLLLELTRDSPGGHELVFGLVAPEGIRWLDGSSDPIHETNETAPIVLTDETVRDYIRFFFFFVRGGAGAFVLLESPDEIAAASDATASGPDGSDLQARMLALRERVTPLPPLTRDENGQWVAAATVAYDGAVFAAKVRVFPDGNIEMIDDEPIGELDGLSVTDYPSLGSPPELTAVDATGTDQQSRLDKPRDREVTQSIVAVLLEDAIQERDSNVSQRSMLLEHFNAETGGEEPLARLRRLVTDSMPVIIIESDVPLVEDFVAGLIDGPEQLVSGGAISRATIAPGDELRCTVEYDSPATLFLLSFHAYRGLVDAERTAHELALRDATVLVGCERLADVPEPVRRIADLVLAFPRIDRGRFGRIFERVFGVKPTRGWDTPGTDWTRYLVPADFHAPRRLGLESDQALEFLKERVQARLKQVTPDTSPGLSELHGLGEARQICEDFVTDIRAAESGQIPWTAVDRGLLLVGAPGTGKTTLARALARECGIKFVAASAARWQSMGALDAHLQAMRADFSEARRYAPTILFIDEIDSIGSREQLAGDRNIIYQTEVINALLEQIQGMDPVDPVIVIGATNYLERVDPALRRAGRLDQAVQLPLPNIPSLKQIFTYYLKPYSADGQLAGDVDPQTLAELSLGLTGADVEFFVRGAARRARHAKRKIKQEDLLAEVTRRPRRPDSAPRLTKAELRRVAVHEAGHAVARLISSTHGDDISFITVIPRLDGSLGFVASVPPDRQVETRHDMFERLEVVLSGRAAEEVVFGGAEISSGAGGPGESSDLAVATSMAVRTVCQTGLGEDGALRWTDRPTPDQDRQIDSLLTKAYSSIVARLETQRPLLDQIVSVLEEKQELSGAQLRKLCGDRGPDASS